MTDPCSSYVSSCSCGGINHGTTAHVTYRHAALETDECDLLYEIFLVGLPEEGEESLDGSEPVGEGAQAPAGDEAVPLSDRP